MGWNKHLVAGLQPCQLESSISITDPRLRDTSLGGSGTVALLRLPDLVLVVALRGAAGLVDGLLKGVHALPTVLPDLLPRGVHPPLLVRYQGAFCIILSTTALAPIPKSSPRGPSANLLTHGVARIRESVVTVCPVLTRFVSCLPDCLGVVVQTVSSGDALETDIRIAEVEDLLNIVSGSIGGAIVLVAHDGCIFVSWQAVAVVVVLVVVQARDDSLPHRGVTIMERPKAVSRLVDKGAVGIKGDGDSGVVLSVGHMEPGTEDHAPKECR